MNVVVLGTFGLIAYLFGSMLLLIVCVASYFIWLNHLFRDSWCDGSSSTQLNLLGAPPMVHAVIECTDGVEEANLRSFATALLATHPKFQQRPVAANWTWSYWEEDPAFDLEEHLFVHKSPARRADLEEFVQDSYARGIDIRSAPWEIHVWPRFVEDNAKGAFIMRFHHALGDGVTMMRSVLQASEWTQPDTKPVSQRRSPKISVLEKMQKFGTSLHKLLLMTDDAENPLRPSTHRAPYEPVHVNWATLCKSVDDTKKISKNLCATINEVLLTAVSGALRRHLLNQGIPAAHIRDITSVMWVSLIPLSSMYESGQADLGNRYLAAVYVSLPLSCADPMERLTSIQKQMKEIITSPEAYLSNGLMGMFGSMPAAILRPVWASLTNKVTNSMSNVPGPTFPVFVGGAQIKHLVFVTRPEGKIATFCCMVTYNNTISVAMAVDSRIMSRDAARNLPCHLFDEELDALAVLPKVN